MSHLFSATRIGQLTLDNRIVIAPMCQYSADEGKATSWHRIHLGQLAFSGAGLLILEATAVEPAGRISPGDLGLWDDETENALRGVVEDIRAWSPIRLGIQLGHAGRKASCAAPWQGGHQLALNDGGWQTVAPSAVAFHDGSSPLSLASSWKRWAVTIFTSPAAVCRRSRRSPLGRDTSCLSPAIFASR